MKITQGSKKGKRLKTSPSFDIRPTLTRIRKSIFDVIYDYVYESTVLDLFAGAGTLGIEALSRGAKKTLFVDYSKEALKYLRQNIEDCNFKENVSILSGEIPSIIKEIKGLFTLVFLDPPYNKGLTEPALYELSESNILCSDSILVAQVSKRESLQPNYGKIALYKEKSYGDTKIYFFEVAGEAN